MVKLLVFAILLASSPATGLLEQLFRTENSCYSGCYSSFAARQEHLDACKKGCDYKLLNEDCATQCKSFSQDEQIRASCQVGCTLNNPIDEVVPSKPIIAIDPVPAIKEPIIAPINPEPGRPRSIIIIRLRNRPSGDIPSIPPFFNSDPIQFFNNIVKQFQEKANSFEQSIRKSFDENAKDLPKLPEFGELTKNIPLIRLPANIHAADSSSSSESSEESKEKRPLIGGFHHVFKYTGERHPIKSRIHKFFSDVRSEWNDLVRKQPKIPVWIFLGILLSSSAILWYMVMSLCRHRPSRDLSIRAQELVFHPYDYEAYEKEKIQPDDQPYEVTESLPIKVKLSNI